MSDTIIHISHVNKMYKLFKSNKDRLLDTFLGSKKHPRYSEHFALKDVTFDIQKGECVGIIGTNGSGKSTMLKIITGVLTATSGEVSVDGRISALLELGAGFNQEYTGIENIYLNGTMMGYTREEIDDRMQSILDFADIGDFVYQPVKTYSSGMFVRLAFAVAINIDPEILIVDEALSVGDVFFQTKCYKKFEEFKAAGKTILFVSHDLGAISRYCDRAILLNRGVKVDEGSPKDMINLYKKILVGASDEQEAKTGSRNDSGLFKSAITVNPDRTEYGDGRANIIDFAIEDAEHNSVSSVVKGDEFTVRSVVKFNEDIMDPIFTMSFKTVKGIEVTGTNTMFEKIPTGLCKAGETYEATFTQEMHMQGGEYLLSISVTGFEGGNLVAYHRLYDVASVMVISSKDTVGFFDTDSKVNVRKVKQD